MVGRLGSGGFSMHQIEQMFLENGNRTGSMTVSGKKENVPKFK
jgi:hypothetical protein